MRELEIVVTADTLQARQAFKTLDADIAKVNQTAAMSSQDLDALNAQLDKMWGPVQKTGASLQQTTVSLKQYDESWDTVRISEAQADRALSDLHINLQKTPAFLTTARTGLNEFAVAAGVTVEKLGLMNSIWLTVAAGVSGWQVGRWIADWGGFDEKISSVTASLLGYDKQLAAEVAGAKQEALAFQTLARINAMQQSVKIEENWHNEIAKTGVAMEQLVKDIESHKFSLEDLGKRYGVTIGALKQFQMELREGAAESKRAADQEIRDLDAFHKEVLKIDAAYVSLNDTQKRVHASLIENIERARIAQTKFTNEAVLAELSAQIQLNQAQGLDASGAIIMQTTALGTLNSAMEALHQKKAEGISQAAQEQVIINEFTQSLYDEAVAADKARDASAGLNAEAANIVPTMAAATAAVSAFATSAINGMAGIPISVNGVMRDLFGRPVAGQGASTIFHDSTPFQQRASGGPVSAGSPYLVGERGPELFVPNASGSILPNGGGGSSFVINIHGNVDSERTAQRLADDIAGRVMRRIDSQRRKTFSKT